MANELTPVAANMSTTGANLLTTLLSGEALAAGDAVYQKASDSKLWKAKADAAGTATVKGIVMYLVAAADLPAVIQVGGSLDIGATVAVGQTYVLSAAVAGGINLESDNTTGNIVSIIGVGSTAALIAMKIHNSGVAHA